MATANYQRQASHFRSQMNANARQEAHQRVKSLERNVHTLEQWQSQLIQWKNDAEQRLIKLEAGVTAELLEAELGDVRKSFDELKQQVSISAIICPA